MLPTSSMVTLRPSGLWEATCPKSLLKSAMPEAARVLIGPAEMPLQRMPNGDILVTEQNSPGFSGSLNGTPLTWNYAYITKETYTSNAVFYAPPGKTPKESK